MKVEQLSVPILGFTHDDIITKAFVIYDENKNA